MATRIRIDGEPGPIGAPPADAIVEVNGELVDGVRAVRLAIDGVELEVDDIRSVRVDLMLRAGVKVTQAQRSEEEAIQALRDAGIGAIDISGPVLGPLTPPKKGQLGQ